METCPKIGDRVQYVGCNVIGPCSGTVMAIYEEDEWDEETGRRFLGRLAPEREWSVGIKVDAIPAMWPYIDTDRFAPKVADLVLLD